MAHHATTLFSFLNPPCYIVHQHLPETFHISASLLHELGRVWCLDPSLEVPRTQAWQS